MNVNYPIIDADGHVMETDAELREFLEGRYRQGPHFKTYSYFPSLDGWNRGFGVPGKVPETPRAQMARASRRTWRPYYRALSHRRPVARIDSES